MQYDSDNNIIVQGQDANQDPIYEMKVTRSFVPSSGFVKQSTGADAEADFQTWAEAMVFVVDGQEEDSE